LPPSTCSNPKRPDTWSLPQAVAYIATQKAAVGMVSFSETPPLNDFLISCVFACDPCPVCFTAQPGLGPARRKFLSHVRFELRTRRRYAITCLWSQHSFPLDQMFHALAVPRPRRKTLSAGASLSAPNVSGCVGAGTPSRARPCYLSRAKVPPPLQRFKWDDLYVRRFPLQTPCFDTAAGVFTIPDRRLTRANRLRLPT